MTECNFIFFFQQVSIDTCLGEELNSCDGIIKQDCEYLGEPLLNTNNIADAKHCQELCGLYADLGCQYWVFQKKDDRHHDCLLLKGGERNCGTTGGPKSPPISDCSMGNMLLLIWYLHFWLTKCNIFVLNMQVVLLIFDK